MKVNKMNYPKFRPSNKVEKKRFILSLLKPNERITASELFSRTQAAGYAPMRKPNGGKCKSIVNPKSLAMYIRWNFSSKEIRITKENGLKYYQKNQIGSFI